MIQSRLGKYAIVGALACLALVFGTARAKKPRVTQSLAVAFASVAVAIALGVKVRESPPSAPVGDPAAFIVAVPGHLADLQAWCQAHCVPAPPASKADWDEWLWTHREALGEGWPSTAPWLVAAYGELLRSSNPKLQWVVRGTEPTVAAGGRAWLGRRLFFEVHEAVFADA
jgi:hypothetical protein